MDRSGSAFEITLLVGQKRGLARRRRRGTFARTAMVLSMLEGEARRAEALRYLEDVVAPSAIRFCHRLARRLARYR